MSLEESLVQQNNKAETLIQSNNDNKNLLQSNNEEQTLLQPNDDIESRRLCFTAASNLYSELVIPEEDEEPVGASKRSYEASHDMFMQLYHRSLADSHGRTRSNNSSINVRFASNPLRQRTPRVIRRHQLRIARLDSVIDQVINRAQLRNQDTDC